GHGSAWFHLWWRRYRALGPNGLFDLTRSNVQPRRISAELERTIIGIRQRLASQAQPGTRYSLIGASSILAELRILHIRPLPSVRTIERVLERNGETVPKVRLAPYLARSTYPKPQVNFSNQLHQVDAIGPIYLKGNRQRYYIFTCKDVYDGAVFLKLYRSRKMEVILDFLGECWKNLGLPEQVQFDNAREIVGWGPAARYLSRVLRLCLRFRVEVLLIPPGRPQHNGAVENFHSWFSTAPVSASLLSDQCTQTRTAALAGNGQSSACSITDWRSNPGSASQTHQDPQLPPHYVVPTEPLSIAAGHINFFRQVTAHGNIHLLSQTFYVGKRVKGEYVKVRLDTKRAHLTVYRQGRIFKRWSYPFLKK
ncbi:MAG TPA: hypothetical protein VIS72_13940, partial [Anaerolineales bacterium]